MRARVSRAEKQHLSRHSVATDLALCFGRFQSTRRSLANKFMITCLSRILRTFLTKTRSLKACHRPSQPAMSGRSNWDGLSP